jgi:hypothetical protein
MKARVEVSRDNENVINESFGSAAAQVSSSTKTPTGVKSPYDNRDEIMPENDCCIHLA